MIDSSTARQGLLRTQSEKPAAVAQTLGRLARYFAPYRVMVLIVVVASLGSVWTQVTTPQLIGQAVDHLLAPAIALRAGSGEPASGEPSSTWSPWWYRLPPNPSAADYTAGLRRVVLIIAGLYLLGALLTGVQTFTISWIGQRVLRELRITTFAHLQRLSLGFYAEHEAGALMSRVTSDMDTLQQSITGALTQVVSGILLLLWIASAMLRANLVYGLIAMAVAPLMYLVARAISERARTAFRQTRAAIGDVHADLQEGISAVREIQAFAREGANLESFRASNAANRDANIRAVSITAALQPSMVALSYLGIALVTGVGGLAMLNGWRLGGSTITLGLVVTFLSYTQQFNQPILQISTLWTNLQSAVAGAERILELLDTQPDVSDAPGAPDMPPIRGKIEFDHVYAGYKPGVPVLKDVQMVAEPGQMIAIVGPTGAGKTTLVSLVLRFWDVTHGAVRIDDIDVRAVTAASVRRQIGLVLQDTFLFSDTVINNIRFGRPDATDEEVQAIAKLVGADEFIRGLPQGYHTVLGEHGTGLSQGQRQLIAIARAAIANPRILILDEATSAVDTRTERRIQKALDTLLAGRTSLVIAHRLSTIRNADQVMVIADGRLVERGKHDELLARRGVFYELYHSQFRSRANDGMPRTD